MNNSLTMKMQKALCDLVDNSACLVIRKTSPFTFNIRSQISSCNKVLDDVATACYSVSGRQLID